MSRRPFIVLAAIPVVLLALIAGMLVYDGSKDDTIAKGVVVGGVDLSGMDRVAATAALRRQILEPLSEPVKVDHGSHHWTLSAREARIATNLDATVDEALERSRTGNILQRTARNLTGGEVHAVLEPEVTYSEAAVTRLLVRVRKAIDRAPVDATATFAATGMNTTPERVGLRVKTTQLRAKINHALTSPTAGRRFSATTTKLQPKVTDGTLREQYDTALIVNRGSFQLTLYKHLKKVKTWSVAIGAVGLETPAGLYHIQNKAVDPAWTKPDSDWVPEDERGEVIPGGVPENPLKARWLGIFDGAGIHGVDPSEYGTIGTAASHGCVRMRIADVEELYDQVPVGAPIYIA